MSILTHAQLSQLSAAEALKRHMAPNMIEAAIHSETIHTQTKQATDSLTIDSPISHSWNVQSKNILDLSMHHITNLESISFCLWKEATALNLSNNPHLSLPHSFYKDSENIKELYLRGVSNGKKDLYQAISKATPSQNHALSCLDLSDSPLRIETKILLPQLPYYFPCLKNLALHSCAVDSSLLESLLKNSPLKKIDVSENQIQEISSTTLTKWASQSNFTNTLPLMTKALIRKTLSRHNLSAWSHHIGSHHFFCPSIESLDTLNESTYILDLRENPLSQATITDFYKNYDNIYLGDETLIFYNTDLLLFILTTHVSTPPANYLFKA